MKKKSQHIKCDVQVEMLRCWRNDLQTLPPNQTFELIIDYPVSNPATYKLHTGKSGMGLCRLLKEIGKAYEKVYAAEDKYGVWGHFITDLAIEGISVDFKKKKIRLDVGS
jgi:hypothetical protein